MAKISYRIVLMTDKFLIFPQKVSLKKQHKVYKLPYEFQNPQNFIDCSIKIDI